MLNTVTETNVCMWWAVWCTSGAGGVGVSHPLSMRGVSGSIPDRSTVLCRSPCHTLSCQLYWMRGMSQCVRRTHRCRRSTRSTRSRLGRMCPDSCLGGCCVHSRCLYRRRRQQLRRRRRHHDCMRVGAAHTCQSTLWGLWAGVIEASGSRRLAWLLCSPWVVCDGALGCW